MRSITGWAAPRASLAAVSRCGLLVLACAASAAWGQTPVTPPAAPPAAVPTPTVVPPASELAPRTVPENKGAPPTPLAPPRELGKPEDDLRLDVQRYVVDDNAPAELRAALPQITARFTGKERGFEDLVGAAAEVTRFLQRELGLYVAYAYLPEQTPEGGVIRIAVLEGRLDRVVLNWRNGIPVDREVVEAYLARLVPGSVLKVRDVERVVFLVNDLRGMTARFELKEGSQPGTAMLVVTPAPERIYTGKIELDRNGTDALGLYRVGGLVQMNSPFGRGDGVTATALSTTTGGLKFALLGYTTPLGSDGVKAGSSLSAVTYQLDKVLFPLELSGNAATVNVYGLYPLVRSRNLNLFTLASLEHKQYTDRQGSGLSQTKKSVDALALGATGDFRDSMLGGGVNTYEATLSSGRVKYAEGRNPSLEDDANYTKLGLGYTRLQDLVTNRALLYFSARGQVTRNNLDTTEQFRLGGPEGVRAFGSGEGTGDLGAVITTELRLLPPEAWFGRIAREMVFSLFGDGGYVQYRHRARSGEANTSRNHGKFAGTGIGLTWVRPGEYSLRLSIAKPVRGISRSGEKLESVQGWLQAAMLFN
jgi:hemolysin activation/secretion protein